MRNGRFRHGLIKWASALLRGYFRYAPLGAGKQAVWHHVVRPLLRTGAELEARTQFGARMMVRFPDTIQSYIYFFGIWEPAITAYLASALQPGDTMIDIGANVGYDSLLAAHCVGPAGRVFAIEASPVLFGLLRRNLALNNTSQVIPSHVAVCETAGDVPVFLHSGSNLGGTTIVPAMAKRRDVRMEATVPGRRLADIVPEEAVLSARLIKIDVEGAEWLVIRGFAELLPRLSPRTELLIEVSAEGLRDHGCTVQQFLGQFAAAGFAPFLIQNRYSVDMYLELAPVVLEPLTDTDFDQVDILFRRGPPNGGDPPSPDRHGRACPGHPRTGGCTASAAVPPTGGGWPGRARP